MIITGPFFSRRSNNANLMTKLIPYLQAQAEVRLLTLPGDEPKTLSAATPGADVPLCLCSSDDRMAFRRWTGHWRAKVLDRNGFSDYLMADALRSSSRKLLGEQPNSAVLTTMEPFSSADAAASLKGVKRKILYLLDPPACVSNGTSTPYRDRRLKKILASQDAILTTPFIRQALAEYGYGQFDSKIIPVGFPLIDNRSLLRHREDDGKIRLLFCGWLYSSIRSPKYFLDILSRLDERFVVTFMGKECEKLTEQFAIQTKAKLITLPQQPYETALQAMADADILINIGNSVPVHMPSKTLEYINTGKPFVNFYKIDDCPTLYYTKRYPLCLNLSEQDPDLDSAAEQFAEFCIRNKGKTVERAYIEAEYADCTPKYIAQKILDALGD